MSTNTDQPSDETIKYMRKVLLGVAIIAGAFILGLCINGCSAQAQTLSTNKGGLAAYAIQHKNWPCESMMRGYKDLPVLRLSILFNTFGTSFSCLNTWAADPRPKFLQTHLINEVCHRNKQCGKYEFLHGMSVSQYRSKLAARDEALLARMREYAQPMAQWYHEHPDVACSLTAGLESNIKKAEYQVAVDNLRPLFPSRCEFGWNPVNNNKFGTGTMEGMIHELHGSAPALSPRCIANFDGEDISLKVRPRSPAFPVKELPSFLGSFASCDAAFLWIAEFNGRKPGAFVDPRKRTTWPGNRMFDELRGYLNKEIQGAQVVPPWSAADDAGKNGCKTIISSSDGAKKDFLWKQSDPICCNRGAVTFLPKKYNKTSIKLSKVYVMQGAKKVATAYERGVYTEDKSNRQYWRFHLLAKSFPYNVVVHYGDVCAIVKNPRIRND